VLTEASQQFLGNAWQPYGSRGPPQAGPLWNFGSLKVTINNRRASLGLAALSQSDIDTTVDVYLLDPLRRLFDLFGPFSRTTNEMFKRAVIDAFVQTALAFTMPNPSNAPPLAGAPAYQVVLERENRRGAASSFSAWDTCAWSGAPLGASPKLLNSITLTGRLDYTVHTALNLARAASVVEAKSAIGMTPTSYFQLYAELLAKTGVELQTAAVGSNARKYGVLTNGDHWAFAVCSGSTVAWPGPAVGAAPLPVGVAGNPQYRLRCRMLDLASALIDPAAPAAPVAGMPPGIAPSEIAIGAELFALPNTPAAPIPPAWYEPLVPATINVLKLLMHVLV